MKINEGLIYTNDKCIGCNRCISACPISSANIAINRNGKNFIRVNDEYCIHCGHCMEICDHGARDYLDDTEQFFEDLAAGEKIALAISPALYLLYPERMSHILGYLRSLGAAKIYDVGFGADISIWCHLKYLENNKDEKGRCPAFVTQECPAIVNYVRKYAPELLQYLIPVCSSLACLGVYVKKYCRDDSKIAYLSSCIARSDDIKSPKISGNLCYNVTFRHLEEYIKDVDISSYQAESDLKPIGFGGTVAAPDGFLEYFRRFLNDDQQIVRLETNSLRRDRLRNMIPMLSGSGAQPAIVCVQQCSYGCVNGSALPRSAAARRQWIEAGARAGKEKVEQKNLFSGDLTVEERRRRINESFKELDADDFFCRFEETSHKSDAVSKKVYDEIFDSMYKTTPELRSINCGACGYVSCSEMAKAIANGYNRRGNCVQYAHEEIRRLYFVDQLTGLSNATAFARDTLEMVRKHPNTAYVMVVGDLDNIQVLNDMYGYIMGDEVLCYLAERLKLFASTRGACARIAGNRFAACVPDNRMDLLFASEYFDCSHLGIKLRITISVGIYYMKKGEEDIERAIEYATLPIGVSQDMSRNTFMVFEDAMRDRLQLEAELTEQMHEALDKGEFKMYLQPQFNHSTGSLVGAESLCRWIKKDGTMIMPRDFIVLFEKNGFIRSLDRYMWEMAFQMEKSWIDRGIEPVPISVNISRISLLDDELADSIKSLREKYDVPAGLVHLEITESAYMRDQNKIIATTRALQKQGFRIAMDDFGSGYSWLNTLKDVPFDILKLDMGFLGGEDGTERSGNILASVMRMAQNLRIPTIAEGVEKRGQADYLKSLGCDVIQGFYYARPMPPEEFEQILCCGISHDDIHRPAFMDAIEVNSFFGMDTPESRMFDYYCGPAVIMEYEQGSISIVRINDRYIQTLGMNKDAFEQVRAKFIETLAPASRIDFLMALEKALETGKDAECVTQRILPGIDEPVWIKSRFSLVASNGDRHVFFGSAENISKEKNSEIELREANERMNMVLDYSPVGICLFRATMKGVLFSMQTLSASKGFCKMVAYPYEEVMSWSWDDFINLVYPPDRAKFTASMLSSLATTRRFSMVYRAVANDGKEFHWVKIDEAAIRQEDGTFLTFASFLDLGTDEKGPQM